MHVEVCSYTEIIGWKSSVTSQFMHVQFSDEISKIWSAEEKGHLSRIIVLFTYLCT